MEIRKLVLQDEGNYATFISKIILNTYLLRLVDEILSTKSTDPEFKYMKYEALWILINLAMGTEESVKHILVSQFPVNNHVE